MAGPWRSLHSRLRPQLKHGAAHLWWVQPCLPAPCGLHLLQRLPWGCLEMVVLSFTLFFQTTSTKQLSAPSPSSFLVPQAGHSEEVTQHYPGEKHRETPGQHWGQSGSTGTCFSGRPPFPIHFVGCVLSPHMSTYIHTFAVRRPLQLPHAVCPCPAIYAALPRAPPWRQRGL